MATFQERFKGKTTVMGRQGLESVINSCNQPITKNFEAQMYINPQRGLPQQQQVRIIIYQSHQISYQQTQNQKPQQQQYQQQQHISLQSTSNPYQHNPYQVHDSIEYATYQMNSPQSKYYNQSQQQQQQQYQQETRKTEIPQRSQSAKQQQNEDLSKYQPYTLKDYEVMKKTANAKLGGLGPNTYSDEWVKEKEKQIKRVEFAEQVRQFNSANITTNRNKESRQQEPNARMKAMEFAKNIPRPKAVQKGQKKEETKQELKSETKMSKDPFDDEIARLEREHLKYLNQLDKINIGEFDAFTSLKALRDMKKQLEAKQCQDKAKPILQYIQKQQPLSMYDLRIQFQHWLAKSTELDTRQIAYTNIFQLVQQNQSQNALQLMLSCLQIPIYMKSSDTIIKTINIIVGIYGDQINVQEIYKFIEIVLKHFSDQSSVIQQSCAECWITIYTKNVSKRNLQQRVLLMFSTLSNLIGQGANRQTQETSAIVLSLLFETLHNNRDITFMKEVLKEFYQIYIKSSVDNAGIYTGMFYLLKSVTIQNFTNCQIAIIDKALQTINNLKFNYRTRIGACNLMKLIATQYQNSNFKVILGNLHEQVIVILDESTKDRVIAVQNSARQALKEWMKLKLQVDAIADIEQNIDLENSNGFLKKNTGTGGGQVFVNQITAQRQPDLKQQIMQNDLDQTVDFNNIQNEDNLNIWQKALKLDQNGLTEDAIQLLLQDGDDLYLLRFLMQYNDPKTLFDKLNISLALRLVDTLIIILESDFLNLLCLDFVQGYMDIGLKDWFVDDDFIEYLAYFADQNTLAAQSCRQIGEQLK